MLCMHVLAGALAALTAVVTVGEPSSIDVNGTAYGAMADERGPIGGGPGYVPAVTSGDITADTLETLIEALATAQAGQTVFVPGAAEIDFTTFIYIDQFVLEIPEGVTLASDRGVAGSPGALLFSDALKTRPLIRVNGPGVRISGLRIRGPNPKRYLDHHDRAFGQGGDGHSYYYKFPVQQGISTVYDGLEVDNCEISGFGHAGVGLSKGQNHHIHHNYIHHCQYNGLGYGISHNESSSLIERNLFDWNRHSIAGSGRPGSGYTACHNVELGTSLSHCFDMHGGRDRKDGTDIAGMRMEIHHNTFRAPQTPIVIRGVPEEACEVYRNWFPLHAPGQAVRAGERTTVSDNAYGADPTQGE